jgi:hypothetical protein
MPRRYPSPCGEVSAPALPGERAFQISPVGLALRTTNERPCWQPDHACSGKDLWERSRRRRLRSKIVLSGSARPVSSHARLAVESSAEARPDARRLLYGGAQATRAEARKTCPRRATDMVRWSTSWIGGSRCSSQPLACRP